MTRWRCLACSEVYEDEKLLRATSPFDPMDTVIGCPACKQHSAGFEEMCDEEGCTRAASCGWKPKGAEYRRTCGQHMGEHDWGSP